MNQDLRLVEENGKKYYDLTIFKKNVPYHVLFVEDDLDIVKMYQWKIAPNGYAATTFKTKNNKTIILTLNVGTIATNFTGRLTRIGNLILFEANLPSVTNNTGATISSVNNSIYISTASTCH